MTTATIATATVSTPERLARVLDDAGLPDMAQAARVGLYDEWRSTLHDPRARLVADLHARGRHDLAARAAGREFDPTPDETLQWLDSEHARIELGQVEQGAYDWVLRTLMRGGLPLPDDLMYGLVARHVARCTDDPWRPPETLRGGVDLDHDAVHAVWHLARLSGGRDFTIVHSDPYLTRAGRWRVDWRASVTYHAGHTLTVEDEGSPAAAADNLAARILVGSRCAGCNRPAGLTPGPGRCRWRRYGPRWVGACGAAL